MLSALAVLKDGGIPAQGFFNLAEDLGLASDAWGEP